MESFNPAAFAGTLALLGIVILLAGALSGVLDRWGVPQVALFLALGTLLGPFGFGLISFPLDSAMLGAVATLSLVLVLFTDAVSVDRAQLRQHLKLALVVLGPGTVLTTLLITLAARVLLSVSWPAAFILGAALASTDPVMMRGLLRRRGVPASARYALGLESGLNDVVVLPVVLVAMAILAAQGMESDGMSPLGHVALTVVRLGPAAGALVGFLSVRGMVLVRRHFGMRRDYESLYVLAVAFTAFAAAEFLHASGFMAVFTAGLVITFLDVELCDCFHDYGEATSEMLLLFAFVAFGSTLIWTGLEVVSVRALLFALVGLGARTVVLLAALARAGLDRQSYWTIVLFGPRALSSLLLVLLPVFAGLPEGRALFPYAALTVLLSVVVHGAVLFGLRGREQPPAASDQGPIRLSLAEVSELQRQGEPVRLLDVRTERGWQLADTMARGAVRVDPTRPVESAADQALPKHDWLVAYCA